LWITTRIRHNESFSAQLLFNLSSSQNAVEPKPVPDKRRFGCHPPGVRRRDRRRADGDPHRAEGAELRRDPGTPATGHFTGIPVPIGRGSRMATAAEPGR